MAAKVAPATLLTLIVNRAPALREAGVSSLTFGDVSIALTPWDPPIADDRRDRRAEDAPSPRRALDDPDSYPGGSVPGFTLHDDDDPT